MQATRIEASHVTKIYYHRLSAAFKNKSPELSAKDKLVIDDVSFVLNSGDIIGLIGRNGAGKSTLLSMLTGISTQTRGTIRIAGKVTAVMTLGIGLREDLTGRENIYLDGELQGKTGKNIDLIIEEIIAFAELQEFIDRPVKTYSTGMKSRLAFSMLVCIEPEILIIDEALSAGDIFFAAKAARKIREICQKGKIVIIVSHSMTTIKTICNRCLWLEGGKIYMDNTPELVTNAYLQKIREESRLSDLQKTATEISYYLENAKYKISHVVLKSISAAYEQTVFDSGSDFLIEIKIDSASQACENYSILDIGMLIERCDGTRIVYEQHTLNEKDLTEPTSVIFRMTLDTLPLNKGFYQLNIELFESGLLINKVSKSFEVRNYSNAAGGVPMLNYPAQVRIHPIQENQTDVGF